MWSKKAREEIKDGRGSGLWHYTISWGKSAVAYGACAEDCPGHASEAEAYEHERQRLVAALTERDLGWGACHVEGCDQPARKGFEVREYMGTIVRLCEEHCTREVAETFVYCGESWGS